MGWKRRSVLQLSSYLVPLSCSDGEDLVKVELLPRGIRVYFWISHVHVWADGKDDIRCIYMQRLWGFLPSATGGSSA